MNPDIEELIGFLSVLVYFSDAAFNPRTLYGINLLKPSGFFTYHQVKHLKILHGARFVFRVDLRTDSDFCLVHH